MTMTEVAPQNTKNHKSKSILFAGGGTGGHIYPAIAIAKAIQEKSPQAQICFVGTKAGLESKIVPREGYRLELIDIGKLNHGGSLLGKLKTLLGIPVALWQSFRLLRKLKPDFVLGVGGYASGPVVLIARILGIDCGFWEANAVPGLTNRILSRFVRVAFTVFPEARNLINTPHVLNLGLPVRSSIEAIHNEPIVDRNLQEKFKVLVFGGSQGARAINECFSRSAAVLAKNSNIEMFHQTGSLDYERISHHYQENAIRIQCSEYIHNMEDMYRWADLVICRAGAGTVTEITATKKVALFIPLPTAADNHQQKNAESLVNKGAALMILQKDLSPEKLVEEILRLKKDSHSMTIIRRNLEPLFQPRAAHFIADEILHRTV
jgi:UDP-N-acetylglucosamine--N-acetylmuramyl-(pentapeptide) pyrophosphoryl-undecaprenol N-acetylglucosamine transferase